MGAKWERETPHALENQFSIVRNGDRPMIMMRADMHEAELCTMFQRQKRVECAEFLSTESADRLVSCLKEEIEWSTVFVEHGRMWEVTPDVRQTLNKEQEVSIASRAYRSAVEEKFSFYYETNRRSRSGAPNATWPSAMQALMALLNSDPVLQFVRNLSGISEVTWANAQVSRFSAGHFLAFHDDEDGQRRLAYVLNLTREWKPSWGGLLQFRSSDGDVIDTYVPLYNSLCLFAVPQEHCVSCVAPFAQGVRLAISGWFHGEQS